MKKRCQECGALLEGRSDKKYCNDYCRNQFNNRMIDGSDLFIRRVNRILKKNRNILKMLNPIEQSKVSKDMLLAHGFNFFHFTSVFKTPQEVSYFFCYDQGYYEMKDNLYGLVVMSKELKLAEY